MSPRSPESAGIAQGALRFQIGRARVYSAVQAGSQGTPGIPCEVWWLEPYSPSLDPLAERLLSLGRRGIGRFTASGRGEGGLWLRREVSGTPLDAHVRACRAENKDWAWYDRVRLGLDLASLLEECEFLGIFPGAMRPSELVLDPQGKLHMRADSLVGSLLGLENLPEHNTPGNSLSPRWMPPEQAGGAEWDAAANRYTLGLVLYWLLAGSHAFAGLGLRHGLEEQRLRGAPPLPDAVAQALPPGLQGLVLRMLDPELTARPASCGEVAERLRGFLQASPAPEAAVAAPAPLADEQDPQGNTLATLHSAGNDPHAAPVDTPAQVSVQALMERRAARRGVGESSSQATSERASEPRVEAQPARRGETQRRAETQRPPRSEQPAPRETTRRVDSPASQADPSVARGPQPRADTAAQRVGRLKPKLLAAAPLLLGAALAGWLMQSPPAPAAGATKVRPRAALDRAHTTSEDCASCHARQTAEWRRSVMAHSVKSPLFQGLEMLIQEQVGKDLNCPGGAGVLRRADSQTACRDAESGLVVTGSGGEHWCVNCHAPGENLAPIVPAWDGTSLSSTSRQPLRDILPASAMEGISCAFCHSVSGPVRPGNQARGAYEGNPAWRSTSDGRSFSMRPEDSRGQFGIANSGYFLDASVLLSGVSSGAFGAPGVARAFPGAGLPTSPSSDADSISAGLLGGVHMPVPAETKRYLQSSEFCGACHDVRLFGSDVLGSRKGEHFKRLRNAYSEWVDYSNRERAQGKQPASCQDCHMSSFPGVCVPDAGAPAAAVAPGQTEYTALTRGCPPDTRFEPRAPGEFPKGRAAVNSVPTERVTPHYFSGVDLPLGGDFASHLVEEARLDQFGIPLGARARRDLLLGRTFRFEVGQARRQGSRLEVPLVIENVLGGHRVPAGFSQEREFWVHLKVSDAAGRVVYEVGRVDDPAEDLHDKEFLRVNVRDDLRDGRGRPLGLFGADVADGRDVPRWSPDPHFGGTDFRGRGLINLQNGFLRCVVCIGRIDERGQCQALPGQETTRALRFTDGDYDIDTGECRSNLSGENALFETYFPIGGLDASRGVTKGPDAIIDRRSAPPGVPLNYTYDLFVGGGGPYTIEAELLFRAFPPFLIKAFAEYERVMSQRAGQRPSGPLVTLEALNRLEVVELARVRVIVP